MVSQVQSLGVAPTLPTVGQRPPGFYALRMSNRSAQLSPALMVGLHVTSAHQRARWAPIVGPDEAGRFPEWGRMQRPVVVDANILRRDLGRVCRNGERLVMVSAANTGAIRLYCCQISFDLS